MNEVLFIRKWVEKEKTLEAEVIQNISKIKKLRKFQDNEAYWDLITACWKLKNHVDNKQLAFKKRFSKKDRKSSNEKTILIHAQKRKVTNAFIDYARNQIDELESASEGYQRKWLNNADNTAVKTKLSRVFKLWTDSYIWNDEDIVDKIFTHMSVYNEGIYPLRKSINSICKLTKSNNEHIIKYLMNQFAKKNKGLFESNQALSKNN
jgi:hypothetical protein